MPARSKTKTTGKFKQPDVEVGLVEGAREERRVDRDDRLESAHRHAGRRGHRVLLGDADVEESIAGSCSWKFEQAGRTGHRGGDRDDALVGAGEGDERVGEGLGEGLRGHLLVVRCRGGSL